MTQPAYLTIGQLADIKLGAGRYTRIMPQKHLKYAAPGVDGLGLCPLSLQVPESVVLFIAPAGCARHVYGRACALNLQDRIVLLRIEEHELVNGSHLERVPQAVETLLERMRPQPRALFLCSSCVDTLLASDYEALAARLEEKHGLRVRASYMDPILFDSQKSPDNRIQCSMYAFVQKRPGAPRRGVNVLGCAHPLDAESELYPLLEQIGVGPVRHIANTKTLEDLDEMGDAVLNLVVAPNAKMAAGQLERRLKIPYIMLPVRHDPDAIREDYRKLGERLGATLPDGEYYRQVRDEIERLSKKLHGCRVAIGKSSKGNLFSLARYLTQQGLQVAALYKNKVTPGDMETVRQLAEDSPNTLVYAGDHPTHIYLRNNHLPVDVAIGADAAYFHPEAGVISYADGSEPFGYRGTVQLFRQMAALMEERRG